MTDESNAASERTPMIPRVAERTEEYEQARAGYFRSPVERGAPPGSSMRVLFAQMFRITPQNRTNPALFVISGYQQNQAGAAVVIHCPLLTTPSGEIKGRVR